MSYRKSYPVRVRLEPLSPSPVHPQKACLTIGRWWNVAKFTNAICQDVIKSIRRVPTWKLTKGLIQERSHTNALGMGAVGVLRGLMSWQGITESTPVLNLSSVISATDNSREVITCLYTWRGTNFGIKSSHVEYWKKTYSWQLYLSMNNFIYCLLLFRYCVIEQTDPWYCASQIFITFLYMTKIERLLKISHFFHFHIALNFKSLCL